MAVMTGEDIEERFGISSDQLDRWEKDAADGVLRGAPSEPSDGVLQVAIDLTLCKVDAIDRRAAQLGMKRSDYLRHLVDEDLRKR